MARSGEFHEFTAVRVNQWLADWNQVPFDSSQRREKPPEHFYLLSIPAGLLKALTGIQRRSTATGEERSRDIGIQRLHEADRSERIREYIRFGYPLEEIPQEKREDPKYAALRKPGWLPTAIVVNILRPTDERRGVSVNESEVVQVIDEPPAPPRIQVPAQIAPGWDPTGLHPLEVIDGQHRLWAFLDGDEDGAFELPVVAFHGLDVSWQAYLFWTINITPKRINASLAYDLYPLLRTEDWLDVTEGARIYRLNRAQELTEALWAYPGSPWYHRVNMLGEPSKRGGMVSQAGWIRALTSTYLRAWDSRRVPIGGLFGARTSERGEALPWTRVQQAAFLIHFGQCLRGAVQGCDEPWAKSLRRQKTLSDSEEEGDPAFVSPFSLLNTDPGLHGLLYASNDLCFVDATRLRLEDWESDGVDSSPLESKAVEGALRTVRPRNVGKFLGAIAGALADYDWRTSGAPELTEEEKVHKSALRGTGGYALMRRELVLHLVKAPGDVGSAAKAVGSLLGYA